MFRYLSVLRAGPMHTASSANRTWSELRSASEYTATVEMPSSLHAQMTRRAISPRFATRIFLNMVSGRLFLPARPDAEERLPILDRLPVFREDLHDLTAFVGLDLIHQLHRFHDAKRLPGLDVRTHLNERIGARARRRIKRPHNGRLDQMQSVGRARLGCCSGRILRRRFQRGWRRCSGYDDLRHRRISRNNAACRRLLQPDPQISPRVLKLLEVVLVHLLQKLLDLLEFRTFYRRLTAWL